MLAPYERPPLATLWARLRFALAFLEGQIRFNVFRACSRLRRAAGDVVSDATAGQAYSASWLNAYSPQPRILLPLYLLAAVPDLKRDSVLVLGPRYETELLLLDAMGFPKAANIALDTYSYSPRIQTGDMHKMPFDDDSFNAVICGWTISYSTAPHQAAAEIERVLAVGGVVVLAVDYQPFSDDPDESVPGILVGADRVQTLSQFDALFPRLTRIAGFEPYDKNAKGCTIVAYRKGSSAQTGIPQ